MGTLRMKLFVLNAESLIWAVCSSGRFDELGKFPQECLQEIYEKGGISFTSILEMVSCTIQSFTDPPLQWVIDY